MVPAGDNRKSQESMDTTFHLNNNIVPQNLQNNISFWYRLEVFCKHTMTKQFDDVYVVSGPVFIPNEFQDPDPNDKRPRKKKYEVLGDNDVAVPTHLFKVVLVYPNNNNNNNNKKKEALVAAFLVPNDRIPANKELTDYQVPIEQLEKYTGLQFFKQVERKAMKPLCEATACKVMTELQLKQWNFARRMEWAKTKQETEDVWSEYKKEGYPIDERTKSAYERKLAEFK